MKCGRLNKLGAYPFKITDKDGNPLCRYAGKEAPGPYAAEGYCQIRFKDSKGYLDYDAYEISGASSWWAFPCELIKEAFEKHHEKDYWLQVVVLPKGDYVETSSRKIYFNWKWEWGPTTQPTQQTTPKERAEEKKSCLDVGGTHCAPSGQCGTGFEEIMGTKCDDIDEVCCKPITLIEPTPSSTDISSMEVSFSPLTTSFTKPEDCYADAECKHGLMKITATCDREREFYIWPGRVVRGGKAVKIHVSEWTDEDTTPGELILDKVGYRCTGPFDVVGYGGLSKYVCDTLSGWIKAGNIHIKITRPKDLCSEWKVGKGW
jgi:hypothetical protein